MAKPGPVAWAEAARAGFAWPGLCLQVFNCLSCAAGP